jgi:hypothetical protein
MRLAVVGKDFQPGFVVESARISGAGGNNHVCRFAFYEL